MKIIKLSNGIETAVDDNLYGYLNQWNWYPAGGGYASSTINGKTVYMHRLIMKAKRGEEVDHINSNKLDNRRVNLRLCSTRENKMNRTISKKNNTSGFKGVVFCKRDKVWYSRIKVNYKSIHLGSFQTKEEAAKIYNIFARRYFGKFAKLNVVII